MNKSVLHWSYRDFTHIPIDLLAYDENLEEVYLKENFITTIPSWFLQLNYLKFLHLAGNSIDEIPEDIYCLENLEFLDVSNNSVDSIPDTIGNMAFLQRLNLSGNKVMEIPSSIGRLKKLEALDLSGNCIQKLPIELSECIRLSELSMNDNPALIHIPERISNMQSLLHLSADQCGLLYLPAALNKFVNEVRLFHNPRITHVPMIYEKFLAGFYETVASATDRDLKNPHYFLIKEKEYGSLLLLPFGTRKVYPVPNLENRITLYDDALHVLNYINLYITIYNNNTFLKSLPTKAMGDHIRNGPIAKCTLRSCFLPLYTTYYLIVVKRRNSTSKMIFTCNFCSMFCANKWLKENQNKYSTIDWEICE